MQNEKRYLTVGPFCFEKPGVTEAERKAILYWLSKEDPERIKTIIKNCKVIVHWWKIEYNLKKTLLALQCASKEEFNQLDLTPNFEKTLRFGETIFKETT